MANGLRSVGLACLAAVLLASSASATPIPVDPIVRVRGGGSASIQIFGVPFTYDFGAFPSNPDPINCAVGTEEAGAVLSCIFQNLTGQNISLLDFSFLLPPDPGPLVFSVEDPDNLFADEAISPDGARFAGGGIPSGFCDEIEGCFGGDFIIDLVGFPRGTGITMTASTVSTVPEPGALLLLGSGLAAAFVAGRRKVL